jgi:hypothetical protein
VNGRPVGASILERAVRRAPMDGHDGRSGALLERVVLDDGTRLVMKTSDPGLDLTVAASGGDGARELDLWAGGWFDDLPPAIGHCLVDGWRDADGCIVTVMGDVGDAVVGWRDVSPYEHRRIVRAAAALHRHFADLIVPGLCTLERRLALLGPVTAASLIDAPSPLPRAIRRGWELFAGLAPRDVSDAVFAVFADPSGLAAALRAASPNTLVHGDLWLVNLALEPDRVVLLDWNLATAAPAALDFASFLVAHGHLLEAGRDAVIADFRAAEGDLVPDEAMRLGYLAGLLEFAWSKALYAIDDPNSAVRARERADLDWWIDAARPAIATGW